MDNELWNEIMDRMADALASGMAPDDIVAKVQRAAAEFERECKFEERERVGYSGQ